MAELGKKNATVLLLNPFPIIAGIIAFVAVPEAIHVHLQDTPQLLIVDQFLYGLNRRVIAVLFYNKDLLPGSLSRGDHVPATYSLDGHGFLTNSMATGI